MGRLFGTDGVRGIANRALDISVASSIGVATGATLAAGETRRVRVVIGRDTRASGAMLQSAVTAGLLSRGADVIDLGVLPTPAVAYLTRYYRADAGVMISASHNPAAYNGIKIFGESGTKLPDLLEEKIEDMVLGKETLPPPPIGGDVGTLTVAEDAREVYVAYLVETAETSLRGMHMAVDCANGSASTTAAMLFSALGVEADILFDSPDGVNINAGCGSTSLDALANYVRERGLCCGIAFDGDADRCLMVDETGALVDGDSILAICAEDRLSRGTLRANTAVGTVMTNFGFRKFCESRGIRFLATQVGDRYVREEMERCGAVLGGEQSGHLIFGDKATTGDGQLTALEVLSVMARSGRSLGELSRAMRRYPQCTDSVTVAESAKARFYTDAKIRAAEAAAAKRLGESGRILLRPSGTEPLIRVMAEGEREEEIQEIVAELVRVIAERLA